MAEKGRLVDVVEVEAHCTVSILQGRFMTPDDAAPLAGMTARSVRNWCRKHDIAERFGGRWVIDRAKFAVFLRLRMAGTGDAAQ